MQLNPFSKYFSPFFITLLAIAVLCSVQKVILSGSTLSANWIWGVCVFMALVLLRISIQNYATKVLIIPFCIILSVFLTTGSTFTWLLSTYIIEKYSRFHLNITAVTQSFAVIIQLSCCICYGIYLASKKIIQENEEQVYYQIQKAKSGIDAELYNIRQQIQPHFLFNSLNSINALVHIAPDRAEEMIGNLSDFLRLSINRDKSKVVDLSKEIDYLKRYLQIEKVRFGDRLQVTMTEDLPVATIPPFIVQPLVENAIKYGLYSNTDTKVTISIDIALEASLLYLKISNPFENELQLNNKGIGYGIENVKRHLYLVYGRQDLLQIQTVDKLFTAELRIPQIVTVS